MKFYPLKGEIGLPEDLDADYKAARSIGVIRIGAEGLYIRVKLRHYYMPYKLITRCFRRVMLVPAKMCCGRGEFQIESLVIGDESGELAQVQLPGSRAAKETIRVLKEKMPHADFSAPAKKDTQGENPDAEGLEGV